MLKEVLLQPVPFAARQIGDVEDDDAAGREFRPQGAPPRLLRRHQGGHAFADALELLGRRSTVVGDLRDARQHLADQAGHADHEEFVEVVGRD